MSDAGVSFLEQKLSTKIKKDPKFTSEQEFDKNRSEAMAKEM
jgi:hypothetical protein